MRSSYDSERQRRIKTVELIEEEQPWFASGAVYLVKIGWDEAALRERLKMAGARWLPHRKPWKPQEPSTLRLGLEERVVTRLDSSGVDTADI